MRSANGRLRKRKHRKMEEQKENGDDAMHGRKMYMRAKKICRRKNGWTEKLAEKTWDEKYYETKYV